MMGNCMSETYEGYYIPRWHASKEFDFDHQCAFHPELPNTLPEKSEEVSAQREYMETVYKATSGMPLESDRQSAWIKNEVMLALGVEDEAKPKYGDCGKTWTERALRYRLLQGQPFTAAALALVPETSCLTDLLQRFPIPRVFYPAIVGISQGNTPFLQTFTRDPWPFGVHEDVKVEMNFQERKIWGDWSRNMARYLLGEKEVWEGWQWERYAPRPIPGNQITLPDQPAEAVPTWSWPAAHLQQAHPPYSPYFPAQGTTFYPRLQGPIYHYGGLIPHPASLPVFPGNVPRSMPCPTRQW